MLTALILAAAAAAAPSTPVPGAQAATAVVGRSAVSEAPGSVPVPQAQAANVICKRTEETGSRTNTKKVCLTRAQWAEQEEAGKASTDAMQTQARATQN